MTDKTQLTKHERELLDAVFLFLESTPPNKRWHTGNSEIVISELTWQYSDEPMDPLTIFREISDWIDDELTTGGMR